MGQTTFDLTNTTGHYVELHLQGGVFDVKSISFTVYQRQETPLSVSRTGSQIETVSFISVCVCVCVCVLSLIHI